MLVNTITRGCRAAALAVVCAAGPLLLSAVANADPDPAAPAPDPQAVCEAPEYGGVFVAGPTSPDGTTHTQCQYIVSGSFYYDNFDNGTYVGTLVYRDGARVPTEHPVMPELMGQIPGGHLPLMPFPGQF
ncbi:hypothetical protein H7K45_17710 [Mycobacterium yunnanensis]|uniref:Secreted protein n=1 Tax=Mycobacterium yunnanensis TaxID=368477 RepID=A0A9X2Z4A4_9MYCO|nr:hypothetical protein [Mycobacterium yunnanensis]